MGQRRRRDGAGGSKKQHDPRDDASAGATGGKPRRTFSKLHRVDLAGSERPQRTGSEGRQLPAQLLRVSQELSGPPAAAGCTRLYRFDERRAPGEADRSAAAAGGLAPLPAR